MDPVQRVRTLADALPFLSSELAADREVLQTFMSGREVPASVKPLIADLTRAINRLADEGEKTNRSLQAATRGGSMGLLGRIPAMQQAQVEIDRLCVSVAQVISCLRAIRQAVQQ